MQICVIISLCVCKCWFGKFFKHYWGDPDQNYSKVTFQLVWSGLGKWDGAIIRGLLNASFCKFLNAPMTRTWIPKFPSSSLLMFWKSTMNCVCLFPCTLYKNVDAQKANGAFTSLTKLTNSHIMYVCYSVYTKVKVETSARWSDGWMMTCVVHFHTIMQHTVHA